MNFSIECEEEVDGRWIAEVPQLPGVLCYGKTADERPCMAIENPVTITDLHATVFTAMGISPKTVFDIENRPFYATEDGKGRAVEDLFA